MYETVCCGARGQPTKVVFVDQVANFTFFHIPILIIDLILQDCWLALYSCKLPTAAAVTGHRCCRGFPCYKTLTFTLAGIHTLTVVAIAHYKHVHSYCCIYTGWTDIFAIP